MTTIGSIAPAVQLPADAGFKANPPVRPDRPDQAFRLERADEPLRPLRPERPDRPDHPQGGPRGKLAHLTRRFVHAAKEILQKGGDFEDIAKLARKVVGEYPALKEFPPFQKIMERIAYHLGGDQGPFVGRPVPAPEPKPVPVDGVKVSDASVANVIERVSLTV